MSDRTTRSGMAYNRVITESNDIQVDGDNRTELPQVEVVTAQEVVEPNPQPCSNKVTKRGEEKEPELVKKKKSIQNNTNRDNVIVRSRKETDMIMQFLIKMDRNISNKFSELNEILGKSFKTRDIGHETVNNQSDASTIGKTEQELSKISNTQTTNGAETEEEICDVVSEEIVNTGITGSVKKTSELEVPVKEIHTAVTVEIETSKFIPSEEVQPITQDRIVNLQESSLTSRHGSTEARSLNNEDKLLAASVPTVSIPQSEQPPARENSRRCRGKSKVNGSFRLAYDYITFLQEESLLCHRSFLPDNPSEKDVHIVISIKLFTISSPRRWKKLQEMRFVTDFLQQYEIDFSNGFRSHTTNLTNNKKYQPNWQSYRRSVMNDINDNSYGNGHKWMQRGIRCADNGGRTGNRYSPYHNEWRIQEQHPWRDFSMRRNKSNDRLPDWNDQPTLVEINY